MKVLVQVWRMHTGGQITSISKDDEQLKATIEQTSPQNCRDYAVPIGEPDEIDLPDDSEFSYMVINDTVFLNSDEMDIIYDNE